MLPAGHPLAKGPILHGTWCIQDFGCHCRRITSYSIWIVTVFDATPLVTHRSGTELPEEANSGTRTFT